MKKYLVAATLCTASIQAGELFPEFRVSYFLPSSEKVRKIYHSAFIGYEFQATYFFCTCDPFLNHFGVFVDVEYMRAKGESINVHDKTSIWIVPVSIGLKYVEPISCDWDVYVGIGPRYYFAQTHDHSPFVKEFINVNGIGVMIEGGFYYAFWRCLTLDLFLGYAYGRLHHHAKFPLSGHTVNLGGLSVGGGLGWCF